MPQSVEEEEEEEPLKASKVKEEDEGAEAIGIFRFWPKSGPVADFLLTPRLEAGSITGGMEGRFAWGNEEVADTDEGTEYSEITPTSSASAEVEDQ